MDKYEVTLDRSGGEKLGIDVEGDSGPLVIVGLKDGLVLAWNRSHPEAEVSVGDRLLEVNGQQGSGKELKALCRADGLLHLQFQRESRTEARRRVPLDLPKSCWMQVTWYLYTHELLGKFVSLASAFAALLGDERCWQTLSLPRRPEVTARMLKLMLVDEQDLWAWPLCQVRQVDLDLSGAEHHTLQHVRALLKKLDVEENLQTLKLRNIPISAKPPASSYTGFDEELILLVNPVHPKYPAGFCSSFLITDELGALRQRFHNFSFSMRPSMANGQPCKALEVVALRGHQGTPWLEKSQDISAKAEQLVEYELGDLRHLPKCNILVTDHFEDWKERMAKTYKRILALHG